MEFGDLESELHLDYSVDSDEQLAPQPAKDSKEKSDEADAFLALDWQEIELGLVELSQSLVSQIDLRRGHRLWTKLTDHWTRNTSNKDKTLLCKKQYTDRTKAIAKIFSNYFSWEMTEYKGPQPKELETVEEVLVDPSDDEGEELGVQVDIGNDEWWEYKPK